LFHPLLSVFLQNLAPPLFLVPPPVFIGSRGGTLPVQA
jgi:hypothetical protein